MMEGRTAKTAPSDDAQTILDAIPDAYISLDGDFRFTFVNRAAERLLVDDIRIVEGQLTANDP